MRFELRERMPVVFLAALLGMAAPPARALIFTVDDPNDLVDAAVGLNGCRTAANTCTLRAAIQEADATSGLDEIDLPAGIFKLTINGTDDTEATGDLDIRDPMTIKGAGQNLTILDASGLDPNGPDHRVFRVRAGAQDLVTIQDLTVGGGHATNGGGILKE